MKRYVLELVIEEGSDEFWESLEGKSGCDDIVEWIRGVLETEVSEFELTLKEYTDDKK